MTDSTPIDSGKPPTLDELPAPPSGKTGWPWTVASEPLPETQSSGKSWPKITVVTPSYNQGAFIEETIRSILLQEYPNLEYIVVDGDSTDQTVEVLEKYDPWIDNWVSEPDEGQSHAINKGLEQSTGEIFNWINSDDLLEPGALGIIARHFDDTDAVIGRGRHFDGEESWLEDTYHFATKPLLRRLGDPEGCSFTQQAVWLWADQVKACGGIDPSFHYAMDRELYVRYTYQYPRVTHVDQTLARFRIHDASKTTESGFGDIVDNPFRRDVLRMMEKIQSMDQYCDLHAFCRRRADAIRWKLFVARLKRQDQRSRIGRIAELLVRLLRHPWRRLDHFTLNTAVRILLNLGDEQPILPWRAVS